MGNKTAEPLIFVHLGTNHRFQILGVPFDRQNDRFGIDPVSADRGNGEDVSPFRQVIANQKRTVFPNPDPLNRQLGIRSLALITTSASTAVEPDTARTGRRAWGGKRIPVRFGTSPSKENHRRGG